MSSDLRDPAHRVSPRARTLWIAEGAIVGVALTVAAIVVVAVWLDHAWGWAIVALVALLGALQAIGIPIWRYRVHRWEASETAVYTQRGWWARERRIAPMSRVQTVDLAQGPLARLFGLATVTVTTASAAGALRIEGLDRDVALRLVDDLTRKADLVEGDAT
ncbi:MAG TPA: PH domain-containing protein [Nocardioides sp.]|nr:PH domain-containing protein [Nocardioides sp.]